MAGAQGGTKLGTELADEVAKRLGLSQLSEGALTALDSMEAPTADKAVKYLKALKLDTPATGSTAAEFGELPAPSFFDRAKDKLEDFKWSPTKEADALKAAPKGVETVAPLVPGKVKAGLAAGTALTAGSLLLPETKDELAPKPPAATPAPEPGEGPKAEAPPKAPTPLDQFQSTLQGLKVPTPGPNPKPFGEAHPSLEETTTPYTDPDTGEVTQATSSEIFNSVAAKQVAALNSLAAEYKAEKSALKRQQLWTEAGQLVVQLAAGLYGLKHGVNMSGVKFDPVDWAQKQQLALSEYAGKRGATQDKYQTWNRVAQELQAGDTRKYQAEVNKFNHNLKLYESALDQQQREYQNSVTQFNATLNKQEGAARLWLQGQDLATREAEARARGDAEAVKAVKAQQQVFSKFVNTVKQAAVSKNDSAKELLMVNAAALNDEYQAMTGKPLVDGFEKPRGGPLGAVLGGSVPKDPEDIAEELKAKPAPAAGKTYTVRRVDGSGEQTGVPAAVLAAKLSTLKPEDRAKYQVIEEPAQ